MLFNRKKKVFATLCLFYRMAKCITLQDNALLAA